MAARTATLEKRMETIMKPFKFVDSNPVTISFFLGKFKTACDCNGVSESVAMCLFLFFTAKSTTVLLTTRMASKKKQELYMEERRGIEGHERIYAYV